MQAILDFFSYAFSPYISLVKFIITTIKDLVYMVGLTGRYLANIPSYFAWMPSQYVTVLTILFSIVVLYKVLGREG